MRNKSFRCRVTSDAGTENSVTRIRKRRPWPTRGMDQRPKWPRQSFFRVSGPHSALLLCTEMVSGSMAPGHCYPRVPVVHRARRHDRGRRCGVAVSNPPRPAAAVPAGALTRTPAPIWCAPSGPHRVEAAARAAEAGLLGAFRAGQAKHTAKRRPRALIVMTSRAAPRLSSSSPSDLQCRSRGCGGGGGI